MKMKQNVQRPNQKLRAKLRKQKKKGRKALNFNGHKLALTMKKKAAERQIQQEVVKNETTV
jgi:hypothetical protein